MRVIFLDIDGVLNSTKTCVAFGGFPLELHHLDAFDQVAIRLLRRLCDSSGIQIVLSSTWRKTHHWHDVGQALGLPIIGDTPVMLGPRGEEISAWLTLHPEVNAYAIIDDDSDMLPDQMERFVQTDVHEGMTWADFQKLCALFGESPYAGEVRNRSWMDGPSKPALAWM